jgi:phenylalanyl-tRNA synthetase beta chain
MNISYSWLKELIDIDLSPEETAAALTRVGLAVEGIHPHGDDFVLDIDLTSNRPDCLSHLGVARELGVITVRQLKSAAVETMSESDKLHAVPFPAVLATEVVRIDAPELCHRFTARVIRGVKIGPSPQWLVDRLEAVGERSINNVADITNYVMLELGQPMHAFDLDNLAEKRIVVRTARAGEKIKTLDEVDRELDETMLAICDAEKPVAVAGVMGGYDSGITESTANVLLEVAYFKRESIRSTSRKLNLITEASNRFERGVDILNIIRASNRATEMIIEMAGGEAADIVDVFPASSVVNTVRTNDISHAVKRLTGLEVESDRCLSILSSLGVSVSSDTDDTSDGRSFVSPSWRYDIAIEEDLVEEIARHAGYENIAEELPPAFSAGEYQPTEHRERMIRQNLASIGFDEAISYSFIDAATDGQFATVPGFVDTNAGSPFVTLRDSVIEGAVRMRPTIIPGLLAAIRHNINHQRRDLKLFEIGRAFSAGSPGELPNEVELFALAVTGVETSEGRAKPELQFDFFDAKGALETALQAAGFGKAEFAAAETTHLQPGQSAVVSVDGTEIGFVGRLNSEISADYRFKQPVYVAEIDLKTAFELALPEVLYRALPRYPSVVRDVSFLVKGELTYGKIRSTILDSGVSLCRSIDFVDIFEGKGLAHDERSLTIRLEYQSDERTLTDEEVDAAHTVILSKLASGFNIRPRV